MFGNKLPHEVGRENIEGRGKEEMECRKRLLSVGQSLLFAFIKFSKRKDFYSLYKIGPEYIIFHGLYIWKEITQITSLL